ncbi:MAG TPA: universal stress protein [Desulfotomaculum sp.]|nr:universal stress protein [Desulfotomaculum sp.]
MYSKILVPVDGSEYSLRAMEHAAHLAQALDARVTLLHVLYIPPNLDTLRGKVGEAYNVVKEQITREGERLLKGIKEKCINYPINCEEKLVWGDPAYEITREGEEGKYDLIVIGGRGMGEIKGWILGSISRRVVRYAKCPVLVIK